MYIINSQDLVKSIDAYCSFFGISKKEFHKDSGISSGTLSQWRSGTYEPDKRSLIKLVQYTGLPVEELMSGNFSGVTPPTSEDEKSPVNDGTEVNDRDVLKRLIDRLTDQEVHDLLAEVKRKILG